MSAFTKEEYFDKEKSFPGEKPKTCFFCGGDLFDDSERSTGGVIYWDGYDTGIALHQPCAEHFGVHLIQDARSIVRKVKRICKINHRAPEDGSHYWHVKDK
jgi:hypothetical protein